LKKLLSYKQWLTVSEAARYLSREFDFEVFERDVIQYALGKHLKLSLFFSKVVFTRRIRFCQFSDENLMLAISRVPEDASDDYRLISIQMHFLGSNYKQHNKGLDYSDEIEGLSGCVDLIALGGGKALLEDLHLQYVSPTLSKPRLDPLIESVVVEKANSPDEIYQLLKLKAGIEGDDIDYFDFSNYCAVSEFPSESLLVIRTEELQRFILDIKADGDKIHEGISNRSFLEALGLMALVIAETNPSAYKKSGRQINATALAQVVQSKANEFLGDRTNKYHGLTNLNKAIAKGIEEINRAL
jgi:hypothetical protein